jgi:hypothetical protein
MEVEESENLGVPRADQNEEEKLDTDKQGFSEGT